MTPFSAIITPQSVSFTTPDGKVHNVEQDHINWEEILEKIKDIKAASVDDSALWLERFGLSMPPLEERVAEFHLELAELVDVSSKINDIGAGRVVVRGGVVYYEDEPVNMLVTERILWGIQEGFDMTAYMLFLDHAMDNPSKRAVDEMYTFMEKNRMGITEDGYILGYKRVKDDFKDIYTGTFDNSPGQIVQMKRNKVNDNPNETCSHGLHFCAMSYLPSYGAGPGNKVVIVKVSPADIVSVPIDYDHAKVRCCKYEVLSEYTGTDLEDILKRSPVWSNDDDFDYREDDDDDYDLDDDYDAEAALDQQAHFEGKDTEAVSSDEFPEHEFDGTDFEDELPPGYFSENGMDMRHIMDGIAATSPEIPVDRPTLPDADQMRELLSAMDAALIADAARTIGLIPPLVAVVTPVEETASPAEPQIIAEATPEGLVAGGTEESVRRAFEELAAQVKAYQKDLIERAPDNKDDGEK